MYRLNNVKIRANLTEEEIISRALKQYKINDKDVIKAYIIKRSIDARNKADIFFNYCVDVELKSGIKVKDAQEVEEYTFPEINVIRESNMRPVVVGFGPAGMFASLILVQHGIKPIILERGSMVEKRIEDVATFAKTGKLNTKCNVQFGEGGAGTFSDGKLTTGNTSIYSRKVLEEFVNFGAPKEILYLAKPHIGTDNLVNIVKNLREYVKANGGTFYFDTTATDFEVTDGRISAIITDNEKCPRIETDSVVLAIGHSARDTFKVLNGKGLKMAQKSFAVGTRIEHLQEDINVSQYGTNTKFELPSAEYKLVYHAKNGRTCYTFCMCPGGQVVASSSEENTIVTNGMSEFKRDGVNANSALLVNITPDDFTSEDPLAGMYFQEDLEKKAFVMGGSNYYAPVQKVEDYLKNVKSETLGKVEPTYKPGVTLSNLNELFPEYVNETMKEALINLNNKLKGFASNDAIMTAVETRTSSPVQITRDKDSLMSSTYGIYPCGEGAGYAGGIMTAAVDGIKIARQILETK